ncbi:MAG: hypothetical protein ACREDE_05360, partial [Thermoplasmata archaeon]
AEARSVSVARPYRTRPARPVELESRRSNAAIPVAVALVILGLYLGTYSIVLTVLLGFVLLVSAGSLLSTRLNPLSATFYLTKKPSFLAIGVVFLGSLILFAEAYALWVHQMGPIVPHL